MRFPWQKVSKEEIENIFIDKTLPGPHDDEYVVLKDVNKVYGNKFHAVHNFNITIKKNEFIVFVGPSGCGKSTTLRMIAGLEDISSGDLFINGEKANDLLSKDRDIAMVFQNYALYPNMTVYKNMAFALQVRHFPKDLIKERVTEAAKILEIEDQLNKKPKELSGGQRQRVALGRAIVRNARIFLMDEPLSNLDAKLRVQMRAEIIRLHKNIHATTIYVTHDQTEAMTMADRIVVMKLGYIQQVGTPIEIYRNPANKFVASFIGSPAMNMIPGFYKDGVVTFANGDSINLSKEQIEAHNNYYRELYAKESSEFNSYIDRLNEEKATFYKKKQRTKDISEFEEEYNRLKAAKEELIKNLEKIVNGEEHTITFGIRPENIIQNAKEEKESRQFEVKLSELLGNEYYIHFDFGGKDVLSKVISDKLISTGENISLVMQKDKIHLFDDLTDNTII